VARRFIAMKGVGLEDIDVWLELAGSGGLPGVSNISH